MIQVALLQEKDLNDVWNLEQICFPDDPWSLASFASEMENPYSVFLVAREEGSGKVVGYGGAWMATDVADVTNLGVDPAYRREGIGRQLLRLLIRIALQKGMEAITLEVRQSNMAAQGLYLAEGFIHVGVRKGYYRDREDAVLMTLNLQDREEEEYADFSH